MSAVGPGPDGQDGGLPPDGPPPTPFERAVPGSAGRPPSAPSAGRRARRVAIVLVGVAALAVGGALLTADRAGDGATADAAAAGVDLAEDAALLGLLGDIDASELVMLAFDDAAGEAFAAATSEEEALAGVGAAARTAVAELRAGREGLAVGLDADGAEAVRAAYLPHLDAWIAYLERVGAEPDALLGEAAEPLILRINATAGVFAAALEEVLAAGAGPEVEKVGRSILDRGFPAQEDADL